MSSLRVLRMRPAGRAGSSPGSPRTSGITATPVSKPERPRASLGKRRSESPMMRGRRVMGGVEGLPPGAEQIRMTDDVSAQDDQQHEVEAQVDPHDEHGEPDGFAKAAQEHRAQEGEEQQGDADLVVQHVGHERVLDDVRGGVRGGERDRDDEVGESEAEEDEHEHLALPAREQLLEHEDAALAVRAVGRDLAVDGQGHEQGHQHQDESGQRREQARGQERDAGLVPERREVVDAGQAHHLPPWVRRVGMMRSLRGQAVEEPAQEG